MQTRLIPCDHEAARLERDFHAEIIAAAESSKLPEELADIITIRVEYTGNAREMIRLIFINWL